MLRRDPPSYQEIIKLPPEEQQKYLPRKQLYSTWEGWYIRTFWKYSCPFCQKRGFAAMGAKNLLQHLVSKHGFGYAAAHERAIPETEEEVK